jgi:hypothetical protein
MTVSWKIAMTNWVSNCNGFTGGKVHKEIFTFTRFSTGPHRGKEWEKVIRPVIEKWGGYVEAHL